MMTDSNPDLLDKLVGGHCSPGAGAVPEYHISACYRWLLGKIIPPSFKSYNELAIAYGKAGTLRFFPLSVMIVFLEHDSRFEQFIKV